MHFATSSLFSIRTVLLILITVCAARAHASVVTGLDQSLEPSSSLLQSSELERHTFTVLEDFLPGNSPESDLDAILVLAERSFVEEILGENDFFILTTGLGDSTRRWLAYLAPENLPFDLALQNSTILLQSLAAPSAPSSTDVATLTAPQAEAFPAQIFLGIDLASSQSQPLEVSSFSNSQFPEFALSEFFSDSSDSIPEPSSAFLLLLTGIATLCKRRRFNNFPPQSLTAEGTKTLGTGSSNLPKTTPPPMHGQ